MIENIRNRLSSSPVSRLETVAFVVGMAILTFELAASRIIAPYLGDTIYTWTSIIGVILAAMAFGYSQGGILADKRQKSGDIVVLLLTAAIAIAVINIVKDPVLTWLSSRSLPLQVQALLTSLCLFAVPTFLLGAAAPYLSRLNITDLASSGRRLSRIDAASTVGSLVGTFLTGYVLFSLIGSSRLLTVISVVLIAVSLLLASRRSLVWQFGTLAVVLLAGFFMSHPPVSGFVADIDSAYSRYLVRDIDYLGGRARVLQTDTDGLQSGIYLDQGKGEAFRYIRAFDYTADLRPDGQRFLIIGGGAFTFPELLARQRPAARVDTVEIDSRLPQISKQYFQFQQPGNLHVVTADGRQFLNQNQTRYDMIYLDAFTSIAPPFQLLTQEAAKHMSRSLHDDGLLVANVISATTDYRSALAGSAYATMRTAFPHVNVYQVYPNSDPTVRQNLLFIASRQPISQQSLDDVAGKHPEFGNMLASRFTPEHATTPILTDDYAPVEQMALW